MSAIPVLQKYTLEELSIINAMREHKAVTFPLNPRINYTVSKPAENQPFNGVLSIEIGDMDDGSPMYIKVKIRGFLLAISKKGDETSFDPQDFHRKSFPLLFDVARTVIASSTQVGGMTPVILNPIDPAKLSVEKK